MSKTKLSFWRTMILAAVVIFCVLLIIRNRYHSSAQIESHDFASKMAKKTKQGRFDEAIQIGLRALQNQSSDELVYQQIADVYLVRAGKEPDHKEEWVSQAVFYTEKSLSLNSSAKDAAGVHLLQDAMVFEAAGDLSPARRCAHYKRAEKILESRAPLLRGDEITLEGRTFQLAPLRKENDKRLEEVHEKSAKAGCK